MKRLLILGICVLPILALTDDQIPTPEPTTATQSPSIVQVREINIRIDPLTEDQTRAGLDADAIKDVMVPKLLALNIVDNDSLQQPILLVRVRTVKVGTDLATFFQLCLLEPAMLIRNRSMFNAITWSQASILTCRPEDLKKEALETIGSMTQAFAQDYITSLQPIRR